MQNIALQTRGGDLVEMQEPHCRRIRLDSHLGSSPNGPDAPYKRALCAP